MENQSQPVKPELVQLDGMWIVRVDRGNGKIQEYRCTSHSQAQQLTLMLNPAPADN